MLEPSKPIPSSNRSAVSSAAGTEKCCHNPGTSTNLKSTISTLFFLTKSKVSLAAIFFLASYLFCSLQKFLLLVISQPLPDTADLFGRLPCHGLNMLNSIRPLFPCADAYDFFDIGYEDLSVPNLARSSAIGDDFNNDLCSLVIGHQNLNLHFRQKIHRILRPSIHFCVSLLAPKSFDLFYGHSLNTRLGQRFLHFVELKGLDNRFHHLHGRTSLVICFNLCKADANKFAKKYPRC